MSTVAENIQITAEVCGNPLSPQAVVMMVQDLKKYNEADVLSALAKCRRTLKGRLTLASIIENIQADLPSADELFTQIAEYCLDESRTFILPELAFKALESTNGGIYQALHAGDRIGARMAFKNAYDRLSNEHAGPMAYSVRIGTDKQQARIAINQAKTRGLINDIQADEYLKITADTGSLNGLSLPDLTMERSLAHA